MVVAIVDACDWTENQSNEKTLTASSALELCMEQVRIYELLPGTPRPPPFAVGSM